MGGSEEVIGITTQNKEAFDHHQATRAERKSGVDAWQLNLQEELKGLDVRIKSLSDYMRNVTNMSFLSRSEHIDLTDQFESMMEYRRALSSRIARYKGLAPEYRKPRRRR